MLALLTIVALEKYSYFTFINITYVLLSYSYMTEVSNVINYSIKFRSLTSVVISVESGENLNVNISRSAGQRSFFYSSGLGRSCLL